MDDTVTLREIASVEDARAAAALLDHVWGEHRVLTPELIRALATHGGEVLAAYRGHRMVAAQLGFLGLRDGRPVLHSHVTGVLPEEQHTGIGFRLKAAQRAWCLDRGITRVTWTFDPLIARNARFNLHKLAAVAHRFHRDFYGPMHDAFNAGERTDRLEVLWDLEAPRVTEAIEGRRLERSDEAAAVLLLGEAEGRPVLRDVGDAPRLLARVPPDYLALRAADPPAAGAWRDAVADALELAIGGGYTAVDFLRDAAYVMERA